MNMMCIFSFIFSNMISPFILSQCCIFENAGDQVTFRHTGCSMEFTDCDGFATQVTFAQVKVPVNSTPPTCIGGVLKMR